MPNGGFYRMLKIVGGYVVDHRPVDFDGPEMVGEWVKSLIPTSLPATLNEMIYRKALSWDGQLCWPVDWLTLCPVPPIPKTAIETIQAILIKKGIMTQEDIDSEKGESSK